VLLTWDGDGQIDAIRAAALFMYGQQLTKTSGVTSVTSPFTLGGLSDPTALAAFWPQFQELLNDPSSFVVPADGISLDSGFTITAPQLEQFKQLVEGSVAPGAVLYRVVSEVAPGSSAAQDLVGSIMASDPPAGYVAHVAGESAHNHDFFKELSDWFPWVILWVFVSSFIVFVVLLRSVALPALAVVVNVLTVGMGYGLLVLLFQGDRFQDILRFTPTGAIEVIIPIVMLCMLFGITMDYAVFMLTRTHESWERTQDNRKSVANGLIQTGRIIVSAALLVVIVTGAFTFTNIRSTKMLGLGIALAIIVDTIFIRMTLLPAVMSYLGRANWWWPRVPASPGGRSRFGAKRSAVESEPD
jgi:uncharacterized membrane protein YdfJ with MMPL/SSD domain